MRRRPLLLAAGLIAALVACAAGGWTLLGWWWGREYDARVAALRARGVPVCAEDLRRPAPPDDENAAPLLVEWWTWWKGLGDRPREWDLARTARQEGWDDEDTDRLLEEARRCLGEARDRHALLARALERPVARYDLDWSAGIDMLVEPIPMTADLVWYLDLRAALLGPGEAEAGARLLLRLSLIQDLPCTVGEMMEATVQEVACELVRRSATEPDFRAHAARAAFDPLLEAAAARVDWIEGWHDECFMLIRLIERWRTGGSGSSGPVAEMETTDRIYGSWWARPLMLRSGCRALDLMERGEEVLRVVPRERVAAAERLDREQNEPGATGVLASLFRPLLPRTAECELRHRAAVAVTRIGLALLEHAEEHGAYPDSLSALEVAFLDGVPEDPYTGGAPACERLADGGVRIEAAVPIPPITDVEYQIAWDLPAR